jgi:hypothetical protein
MSFFLTIKTDAETNKIIWRVSTIREVLILGMFKTLPVMASLLAFTLISKNSFQLFI